MVRQPYVRSGCVGICSLSSRISRRGFTRQRRWMFVDVLDFEVYLSRLDCGALLSSLLFARLPSPPGFVSRLSHSVARRTSFASGGVTVSHCCSRGAFCHPIDGDRQTGQQTPEPKPPTTATPRAKGSKEGGSGTLAAACSRPWCSPRPCTRAP